MADRQVFNELLAKVVVNAEHLVLSEMLIQVSRKLPERFTVFAEGLLNNDACVSRPASGHSRQVYGKLTLK